VVRNLLHRYARIHFAQLRLLVGSLLLFFLAWSEHRAHADPATQSLVFLQSSVPTHPSLDRVVEATRGPLAELGVELLVAARSSSAELGATTRAAHALADSSHAIAVVWLDNPPAGNPGSVIYFFDPLRKRLFTRSLAINESETAAAEEVAVVLRSAVGALLAGADVAMTEVKVSEPAKVPTLASKPEAARDTAQAEGSQCQPLECAHLGVGLGYVGTIVATDSSWQSGARLSLDFRPARSRWVLGAAYQVLPPLRAESSQVTTRLYRHPAELALGVRLLGESFRLEPELAFVADPVLRETERADSPLVATPPTTRWLWALSARIRASWSLTTRLSAVAGLGADLVLNPFKQVTEEVVPQAQVYSLIAIRPLAEAGLAFDLW
jgi:hypothetical protein